MRYRNEVVAMIAAFWQSDEVDVVQLNQNWLVEALR